jgi:hypothetical protein
VSEENSVWQFMVTNKKKGKTEIRICDLWDGGLEISKHSGRYTHFSRHSLPVDALRRLRLHHRQIAQLSSQQAELFVTFLIL